MRNLQFDLKKTPLVSKIKEEKEGSKSVYYFTANGLRVYKNTKLDCMVERDERALSKGVKQIYQDILVKTFTFKQLLGSDLFNNPHV
jgi:hypothetical protein